MTDYELDKDFYLLCFRIRSDLNLKSERKFIAFFVIQQNLPQMGTDGTLSNHPPDGGARVIEFFTDTDHIYVFRKLRHKEHS